MIRLHPTLPLLTALATMVAMSLTTPPVHAESSHDGGLPNKVVVDDSRTSPEQVDISRVRLEASWYWDSSHLAVVRVPGGLEPGQHLTIWYDVDADPQPEGRFEMTLRQSRPGAKRLEVEQTLRKGGLWSGPGTRVPPASCMNDSGLPVNAPLARDEREVYVAFDIFGCFGRHPEIDSDPGRWRAAVRLAKGNASDTAPSDRRWSRPLRGWEPCDPSGGQC